MSSRVTEVVSTAQDVIRLLAETGDARLLGFAEALSTWIDGAPFEAALGLTPNWRKPDREIPPLNSGSALQPLIGAHYREARLNRAAKIRNRRLGFAIGDAGDHLRVALARCTSGSTPTIRQVPSRFGNFCIRWVKKT